MDAKTLLGDSSLFGCLDDAELDLIAEQFEEKRIDAGETLIEEGEPGEGLYVIAEGRMRVDTSFQGERIHLADLGAGVAIGEMSLIDNFPTSATVTAREPSRLLYVQRERFKEILDDNTALAAKLWHSVSKVLADRLRENNESIREHFVINRALVSNEQFRALYASYYQTRD